MFLPRLTRSYLDTGPHRTWASEEQLVREKVSSVLCERGSLGKIEKERGVGEKETQKFGSVGGNEEAREGERDRER